MNVQKTHRKEYSAWLSAKTRCYNPKYQGYALYGGRGIQMDDAWRNDFLRFLADMGAAPAGASLDRVDVNGPYAAWNCRWATATEQGNNTRFNRVLEFRGERMTMTQWARRIGIRPTALAERLAHGWSTDRALTEPLKQPNCTAYGRTQPIARWAREYGLKAATIYRRLELGWTLERALTAPPRGQ